MARESRKLSRTAGSSTELQTIAIVCEGKKTEEIYFNGIRKEYRLASTRLQFVGLGADPVTVVKHALRLQQDYDRTWAVFDVEASGPHGISHASLLEGIQLAERTGVNYAVSHPCFELWLILHFELQTSYLSNEAARVNARGLPMDYNDKGFDFAKVWPHHPDAIENAVKLDARQRENNPKVVDRNPWTSLHELVGDILSVVGLPSPPGSTPGS